MATLFTVLIGVVYLFSRQSPIWAFKSFGTESTTVQPELLPADVGNSSSSSLLSVTYENNVGRSFPKLSFKSRIKAKFPTHRPDALPVAVANRANAVALPASSTILPPIIRSRMIFSPVSLSPFLSNTLHPHLVSGASSTASSPSHLPINHYRNRSFFSPSHNSRILPPIQREFKSHVQQPLPVLITTTSTVRPKPQLTKVGPILSNNATILPNDDYSIEAVIPVNLSAHFKLINSQQQQRVVLNNIQEIINSLKSEELREANGTINSADKGSEWNPNQTANSKKGDFSAFKFRFLEKLREHQNLMKGKNNPSSVNSTKALLDQALAEKQRQNSLKQFFNGSPNSTVKSSAANLFKIESYSLPKRNHNHHHYRSMPLVLGNKTQWQAVELLVSKPAEKPMVDLRSKLQKKTAERPLKQLNSNAYDESQKKLNMKHFKSGRSEEADEGAFMAHLKNYLSKLVRKTDSEPKKKFSPTSSSSSSLGSSSQHLQMIIRSPISAISGAVVGPVAGPSEADHIDYGEVERILAFVNPYGRRISMPNIINTEYSSSLAAESRNVRLQRSAVSSGNPSEDHPLNSLWSHRNLIQYNTDYQPYKSFHLLPKPLLEPPMSPVYSHYQPHPPYMSY